MIPSDLHYTKTHEYLRNEGNEVVVGITAFAIEQLGDVVYLELPEAGTTVTKGQSFGVVESVKAVSDLYAPVSGTVTASNTAAVDDQTVLGQDPYGAGWLLRIAPSDSMSPAEFMTASAYEAFIKG